MATVKKTTKTTTKKTITKSTKAKPVEVSLPENPVVTTSGDRLCYVYVAVNLTRNTRLGEMISLAMVDADGDTFYGEFNDFSVNKLSDIPKSSIVPTLLGKDNKYVNVSGTYDEVKVGVFNWLYNKFTNWNRTVQFVMDRVSWDWPIFKEMLAGPDTEEMPKWVSPVVIDINTELGDNITIPKDKALSAANGEGEYKNFIPSAIVNRDLKRVETARSLKTVPEEILDLPGINALTVASSIRAIHQNMWGITKN